MRDATRSPRPCETRRAEERDERKGEDGNRGPRRPNDVATRIRARIGSSKARKTGARQEDLRRGGTRSGASASRRAASGASHVRVRRSRSRGPRVPVPMEWTRGARGRGSRCTGSRARSTRLSRRAERRPCARRPAGGRHRSTARAACAPASTGRTGSRSPPSAVDGEGDLRAPCGAAAAAGPGCTRRDAARPVPAPERVGAAPTALAALGRPRPESGSGAGSRESQAEGRARAAPGSRKPRRARSARGEDSRRRARVSSASGGRCLRIAEPPSGLRDEEVLERRAVGCEGEEARGGRVDGGEKGGDRLGQASGLRGDPALAVRVDLGDPRQGREQILLESRLRGETRRRSWRGARR